MPRPQRLQLILSMAFALPPSSSPFSYYGGNMGTRGGGYLPLPTTVMGGAQDTIHMDGAILLEGAAPGCSTYPVNQIFLHPYPNPAQLS
jgi:hypothetical protein